MATDSLQRRSFAENELQRHRPDLPAGKTVASLSEGLDFLNDLFITRIDQDVEQQFGLDSMLMPASTAGELRASERVRKLIGVYSAVVAAEEIIAQAYVAEDNWLSEWLLQLRVPDSDGESVQRRVAKYRTLSPDKRRFEFASSLERRMPHATQAPLIIYRLYPLGVRIVAAIAFGDHLRASDLRNQQIALLPVIADCHECHGRLLDNGDSCAMCGSPLWKFDWLNAD